VSVDDEVWEGLRRKYWHGRKEYYLPIATLATTTTTTTTTDHHYDEQNHHHDVDEEEEEGEEEGMFPGDVTADDSLMGTAVVVGEGGEEEVREVLLRPFVDPVHGGLSWKPSECSTTTTNQLLSHLR